MATLVLWWTLMTITTVGNELNPQSFLGRKLTNGSSVVMTSIFLPGKFVGGFCALSGVFILTLPIPIVVT